MHLHYKVYPEGAVSYNFGSILKSLHFTQKHDGNKTLGFFSFIYGPRLLRDDRKFDLKGIDTDIRRLDYGITLSVIFKRISNVK